MEPVYKQHVLIARFQHKENKTKKVDIEAFYHLGGMNYFQGKVEQRGYRLAVTPKEVSGSFIKTTAFTGTWKLLQTASRYSEKTLVELARYAEAKQQYTDLLNWVLEKNNINLADYEKEI